MQEQATGSAGLFIVIFIALFTLSVSSLAIIPAFILWRMTKDKRYPLLWVTSTAIIVIIAAGLTYKQRLQLPPPTPIAETLSGVSDAAGALRITSLRLPHPDGKPAQFEVDVENTTDQPQFLGLQYNADGGKVGAYSPGASSNHHIWSVQPKWKGTLTCDATLPAFMSGGNIAVVLARCKSAESNNGLWLPDDSEALYQNRFVMVPQPGAPTPNNATNQ